MEYAQARVKLPPELAKLTTSQFNTAINEANLGVVDKLIAQRYFIDHTPQADIAAEMDIARLTVTRRMSSISNRVASAAARLPQ